MPKRMKFLSYPVFTTSTVIVFLFIDSRLLNMVRVTMQGSWQ